MATLPDLTFMSARNNQFVVTNRGQVYEARPKNHKRLRVFGPTPADAIRNLRFALRNHWDRHEWRSGEIFNATAEKEN